MTGAQEEQRVLRRLDLPALVAAGPSMVPGPTRVVGVADIETLGVGREEPIIELAVRRLRVDAHGRIVELGRLWEFLQDPGIPVPPDIERLTGLTDADLAGHRIDEAIAVPILRSCDAIIHHHAKFDAPRILDRLPALAGRPFACSMREVDWAARGLHGSRSLGCLLCKMGWFNGIAHRAGADVDSTIGILAHRDANGRTALAELLEVAARPTLRLSAYGAAFGEPKDRLKRRGYSWDAEAKVWSREVASDAGDAERAWLKENVYATRWNAKAAEPHEEVVDWRTRHA